MLAHGVSHWVLKKGEGMKKKERLWEVISVAKSTEDKVSKFFDIFILTLISLNAIAVIIGSVETIEIKYAKALYIFEAFSIAVFTIEYFLRLWLCTYNPKYRKPFWGRIRYVFSFYALIDFAAIAPFYIPFFTVDFRALRIVRFLRIIRVLKFERYIAATNELKKVFKNKKDELIIFSGIFTIILIISSVLLFYAEHHVQPKVFTNIPAALWFTVTTLTRVGYGDMYPITTLGKFFASIVSILGILMVAIPTSILSAGFLEVFAKKRENK